MDIQIFEDRAFAPDKLIGRIDEEGKVYAIEEGKDTYIGYIDYDAGEIFDDEEKLLGWAEDDGTIVAFFEEEDEEEEIGYMNDEGEVYYYDEDEEEVYFGTLKDWNEYSEGAAALLFFTESN